MGITERAVQRIVADLEEDLALDAGNRSQGVDPREQWT